MYGDQWGRVDKRMHPHYLCICLVFTRGILVYGWCCTYEVVWTFATLSRKTKKGKHRHLAAALISRCLQDATLRDTTIRDTTVRSRHTETHTLCCSPHAVPARVFRLTTFSSCVTGWPCVIGLGKPISACTPIVLAHSPTPPRRQDARTPKAVFRWAVRYEK
ncbi:hypothetical protein GGS24DRAFT_405832 [Hypoxylon argillaceum]|nr:hypothetical protein GGS24DRAFT_405832 [Hypoxylon argillaceum]